LQAYGQVSNAGGFGFGGGEYTDDSNGGGDSPTAGERTELSPEENGAIVAVLSYLISNFQHLNSGDNSPLYNTAATHTLE
jgi:hypothetical protein